MALLGASDARAIRVRAAAATTNRNLTKECRVLTALAHDARALHSFTAGANDDTVRSSRQAHTTQVHYATASATAGMTTATAPATAHDQDVAHIPAGDPSEGS